MSVESSCQPGAPAAHEPAGHGALLAALPPLRDHVGAGRRPRRAHCGSEWFVPETSGCQDVHEDVSHSIAQLFNFGMELFACRAVRTVQQDRTEHDFESTQFGLAFSGGTAGSAGTLLRARGPRRRCAARALEGPGGLPRRLAEGPPGGFVVIEL